MLLNCKFLCKKSVYFPINYNYLSVSYDLCKRDWLCDVAYLLERVTSIYMSLCKRSTIIGTLLELCDLRDDNPIGVILNIDEIHQAIQAKCLVYVILFIFNFVI